MVKRARLNVTLYYIACLFVNTVSVPKPQTNYCCTYTLTATVTAVNTVALIQPVVSGAFVPAVFVCPFIETGCGCTE